MNKKDRLIYAKLIDEGKYQEVIDDLELKLKKKPDSTDLLFNHAFVSFAFKRDLSENIIEEFKKIANNPKTPYSGKAKCILCIIYAETDCYNKAYEIGTDPLIDISVNEHNYYYAMAKSCFFLGDTYLVECVDYIDKTLEIENNSDCEPNSFLYGIKADALISIEEFEKANESIDKLYELEGPNYYLYNQKARLNLGLYKQNKDKEYLQLAISFVEISFKYEEDDPTQFLLYAECLAYNNEIEKALKVLDEHKDLFSKVLFAINKVKIYNIAKDYKMMEETAEVIKTEMQESDVYLYLGGFTEELSSSNEDLEYATYFFQKSYDLHKRFNSFIDLYRNFVKLRRLDDAINLINDYENYAKPEELPVVYHLKVNNMRLLNSDYDEIEEVLLKKGVREEFGDFDFLMTGADYSKEPKPFFKELKKYHNFKIGVLDPYQYKDIGHCYLFGAKGFPQDFKKALKYTRYALASDPLSSCNIAAMGRIYEIKKDYTNAFDYYKSAYDVVKKEEIGDCSCGYGYYAHAYIKGIGVEVDVEKAKLIVLEAIDRFDTRANDTVLLQYTYFALLKDERFSLERARSYLLNNTYYTRYHVSRYVNLKALNKALGINDDTIDEKIEESLKHSTKITKNYYNEHIADDAFYIEPVSL